MQLPAGGFLVTFSLLALIFPVAISDPLVPALCIFGDSVVDVGNNNNLLTVVKANFPPYGRDFVTHAPTGRFCNGKLATDFTAEFLGFSSYPPAYLSQDATGNKLLTGANFASAASGFYDGTAQLYVNNLLYLSNSPMGCLPAAITLFGSGSNQCIQRLNQDAMAFNTKLQSTSQSLQNRFSGLKLVVFDIYQPLLNMVSKPADNGFFEARRACCGTGTVETSLLCNNGSIGTCSNATGYVFWDGFHPTEAANKVLAADLISQGFSLI